MPQMLYSRYADGSHPVHPLPTGGYEVTPAEGSRQIYSTKRQLLIGLTGHPKGRNWTYDRYFKLGKYAPPITLPSDSGFSVLDLLPVGASIIPGSTPLPTPVNMERALAKAMSTCQVPITTTAGQVLAVVTANPPVQLGIDLKNRGHEVAKLLFSQYGKKIFGCGYSPEDVLQEVYAGILVRNRGICPWDIRKSSFGHYVCIVCSCILSNYHRKMSRRRSVEQVGLRAWQDGCLKPVDAALVAVERGPSREEGVGAARAEEDLRSFLMRQPTSRTADGKLALIILADVHQGWRRAELADKYGYTRAAVSRALTYLRKQARQWGN